MVKIGMGSGQFKVSKFRSRSLASFALAGVTLLKLALSLSSVTWTGYT